MDNQTSADLFKALDLDQDGRLARNELNQAAKQLEWSWREAPFLAVLDLLTISKPMAPKAFNAVIRQIHRDPMGPYGNILLQSPHFLEQDHSNQIKKEENIDQPVLNRSGLESLTTMLSRNEDDEAVRSYQSLLDTLETADLFAESTAVLIIDPQRSFTQGAWMKSIGPGRKKDVAPIRLAFDHCAEFLDRFYGQMEIMFTRCPFPADSYGWAGPVAGILDEDQLYFVKPGNSVLFPPTNGFRQWVKRCLDCRKKTLVIGGCTLNSCVRVSSIETFREFKNNHLEVIVDLSLSGARTRNYLPSQAYFGKSAVKSAVTQMINGGVRVVRKTEWF